MQRTKIDLQDLQGLAGNYSEYETGAVTAFYDPKAKRYGIVWSTSAMGLEDARTPPVFVAVSQNRNPLGNWTVWALDLRPQLAAGMTFCVPDSNATEYSFDFPQVRLRVCVCDMCGCFCWLCLGRKQTRLPPSNAAVTALPTPASRLQVRAQAHCTWR